jgi:hypothetical protein
MRNTAQENQAVAAVPTAPRFDMYTGIHKAMRAMMADTLLAVGRMDATDMQEVTAVSGRVMELLDFCTGHLEHENTFVHAAIEARAPGASEAVAHEHVEHVQHISALKQAVAAIWASPEGRCPPEAALALYRNLALFVADNFHHMHTEETVHNAVLWARYTDAELIGIHEALLASIPPAEMMFTLRWLVPYMSPAERAGLLGSMREHAPAPAFAAALETVQPHLTLTEWAKLARALGLPPAPGLVQV